MWQPCELLYTCYLLTYLLSLPPRKSPDKNKFSRRPGNRSTVGVGRWPSAGDTADRRLYAGLSSLQFLLSRWRVALVRQAVHQAASHDCGLSPHPSHAQHALAHLDPQGHFRWLRSWVKVQEVSLSGDFFLSHTLRKSDMRGLCCTDTKRQYTTSESY